MCTCYSYNFNVYSQAFGVKEYDGIIILSIQPNKETKCLPTKSKMAAKEILIDSNFERIHAIVIILTSSHRFLGSMNKMEQFSYRSIHTQKQNKMASGKIHNILNFIRHSGSIDRKQ